jgi:hypothetical protein
MILWKRIPQSVSPHYVYAFSLLKPKMLWKYNTLKQDIPLRIVNGTALVEGEFGLQSRLEIVGGGWRSVSGGGTLVVEEL